MPHSPFRVVTLIQRTPGSDLAAFRLRAADEARRSVWPEGCVYRVHVQTVDKAYARGEPAADAIDEYGFADAEAALAWRTRLAGVAAAGLTHLLVRAVVQKAAADDHASSPEALLAVQFVKRRPDIDLARFRAHWHELHGPLVTPSPLIRRYEQYACADAEYAWSPEYDGLALIGFDSSAAMRAYVGDPASREVAEDARHFVAPEELPFVITQRVWGAERSPPDGV